MTQGADGAPVATALTGGDHFGAEVLRGPDRRYRSTVTATGLTKCWMLNAPDVRHAIGSKWDKVDLKRVIELGKN